MRISDWSSDVCSSDLRAEQRLVGELGERLIGNGLAPRRVEQAAFLDQRLEHAVDERALVRSRRIGIQRIERLQTQDLLSVEGEEIGRATCRESVCQYV